MAFIDQCEFKAVATQRERERERENDGTFATAHLCLAVLCETFGQ